MPRLRWEEENEPLFWEDRQGASDRQEKGKKNTTKRGRDEGGGVESGCKRARTTTFTVTLSTSPPPPSFGHGRSAPTGRKAERRGHANNSLRPINWQFTGTAPRRVLPVRKRKRRAGVSYPPKCARRARSFERGHSLTWLLIAPAEKQELYKEALEDDLLTCVLCAGVSLPQKATTLNCAATRLTMPKF